MTPNQTGLSESRHLHNKLKQLLTLNPWKVELYAELHVFKDLPFHPHPQARKLYRTFQVRNTTQLTDELPLTPLGVAPPQTSDAPVSLKKVRDPMAPTLQLRQTMRLGRN